MLTQLLIKNFAVVKSLDVEFLAGMTAITGETGAGKSISVDALGLCLGDRAEANMVRKGATKAEITSTFDLQNCSAAKHWLSKHEMESDNECMIRRVISAEGRSKAYINGTPVALQQLRDLGQYLVSIHGQHAHHQLLKSEHQLQLLDEFASHGEQLHQTSDTFEQLQQCKKHFQKLLSEQQQRADRRQLLEYQVSELDQFALLEDEFSQLETEHKKLSHSQTLLEQTQLSFHQLYEAEGVNALSTIQHSLERLQELQSHDETLSPITSLLNEAAINIEEAAQELRAYTEQLEIDPLKMQQVEARYSQALEFARKHQVAPEQLNQHHDLLCKELEQLKSDDSAVDMLQGELQQKQQDYIKAAEALSQSRQAAAKKLASKVQCEIRKMNMADALFGIEINFDLSAPAHKSGLDEVCFKVTTNPGQPMDKLDKVVSGGELSRIGLAIQVISSSKQQISTMIFDEVDTGISGATATVVGDLLKTLGENNQVMCVTHLPQVAAKADQQMLVTKFSDKNTTETHMIALSENQRVEALAKLLAGDKLTDTAVANARELLGRH